jgi:hypothetical protein
MSGTKGLQLRFLIKKIGELEMPPKSPNVATHS